MAKSAKSKDLFLYDRVHSLQELKEGNIWIYFFFKGKDFVPQEAFYLYLLKWWLSNLHIGIIREAFSKFRCLCLTSD